MKFHLFFLILSLPIFVLAQEGESQEPLDQDSGVIINGVVINDADDSELENVNIVNLNKVIGTTTNAEGAFKLRASVNDTLYFSYLGFRSIRVRVTNDWLKYDYIKVKMTELGIALEEVVVKPVQLTGYVEVDAKIEKQMKEFMKSPKSIPHRTYFEAAKYYSNNKKDLNEALRFINEALYKSPQNFRYGLLKAKILEKNGNHEEALKAVEIANQWAKNKNNDNYIEQTFLFWQELINKK